MPKSKPIPEDFVKFTGFPTRHNCDPDNPWQAFLWMLVALPYQEGAQLALPVDYMQFVSRRLWDLGLRQTVEPKLRYEFPQDSDPNWLSNPGRWVDASTPLTDPRRPVERAVDQLVAQQASELATELIKRMSPAQRRAALEAAPGGLEAG